jgi:hypothetical protein
MVLKDRLMYPKFIGGTFPSKKLIENLLVRNPAARGDPASVKKHSYFGDVNWNELLSR